MTEEWMIGDDDSGDWRTDIFSSRIAAVHYGDELWEGKPFWVARKASFEEWLGLNYFPSDVLVATLQTESTIQTGAIGSLTPLISQEVADLIDDAARQAVLDAFAKHDTFRGDFIYLVETERIDRGLSE